MITPFRDEDFSESMEEIQGAACITRNGAEQIGYGKFALIRREEQLVRNVSAREKQKLSLCVKFASRRRDFECLVGFGEFESTIAFPS